MKESREVYVALAKEKFSEGYSKSENHVSGRLKGIKCTPNWQSYSKIKKDVEALERVTKYAGHILGGPTWISIFNERLIFAPGIVDLIEEYYQKEYSNDLSKLSPTAQHDAPFYIVVEKLSEEDDPIIPVVCKYEEDPSKDCIALLFNRKRILKMLGKH